MDNLGTEVSNKIRSAIKAKLIELDAYVDDELPDYIMVMVANDRNKEQMDDDLGLFLNENTNAFTTWLHNVLDKLRKVTLDEVAKKGDSDKKKKKKKDIKKKDKDGKKKTKVTKEKKVKKTVGKESKNANVTELGSRKKKLSEPAASENEEKDYDAESILKKAVKSSAKSLKVGSAKKGTPTKKIKKKKIINLREDQEFFQAQKIELKRQRSRSRSFSVERRGGVASQVQIVKKPPKRSRSRSYERRSVASKAILPPRPARPTGREQRGVASLLSRGMRDADRSMRTKRYISPPAAYRRGRSPSYSRSPLGSRGRDRDRGERRFPRVSPDDIERFQMIKAQHIKSVVEQRRKVSREEVRKVTREDMGEVRKVSREDKEDRKKRDRADKDREEARRLKREVDMLSSRQLAMDRELEKLGRASSLDRELKRKRDLKKRKVEAIDLVEEEDDDEIRIIVRRDDSEKDPSEKEEEVEEEKVVVEEELVVEEEEEEEVAKPSPPKKQKKNVVEETKEEPVVEEESELDLEDADLLEMRRKALESLMRRREEERKQKEDRDEKKRRRELERAEAEAEDGERKIIIPLNEDTTDSSDSSGSDSDVTLSDVEDLKRKASGAKSGRNEEEGEEGEPTFIVTMDGIDEKYFKHQAKKEVDSSKKAKNTSPDDELQLHPDEDFDSPRHSPKIAKKSAKVKALKSAKAEKSAKPTKVVKTSAVVATTALPTKTIINPKFRAKVSEMKLGPVKQVKPKTPPAKPVVVQTKPAVKIAAKPAVKVPAKTAIKVVAAPVKPTVKSVKPTAVPVKTTTVKTAGLAVKTKPVKTKIILRPVSCEVPVAVTPKPKPKFTPISAPAIGDSTQQSNVISLKPRFKPVAPVVAFNSLPTYSSSQAQSSEICKYFPKCARGAACFFRHPSSPAEALLLKQTGVSKFKWSAR